MADVKSVAEGARRYHDEVLSGIGDPETVRNYYYAGKKIEKKRPEALGLAHLVNGGTDAL